MSFYNFLESFNRNGIGSKAISLQATLHGILYYKDAYHMFHICTIFQQIISLNDTIFE